MAQKPYTGEKLTKWREEHEVSQTELAEILGVHWLTISAWERGRQKIPKYLELALRTIDRENLLEPKRKTSQTP